jgi:hypothetical protein
MEDGSGARRIEYLHDLARAPEGSEGGSAPEKFPQHHEVRLQTKLLGGPTHGQTQHQAIVEDAERAVTVRKSLNIREKSGHWRHHAPGNQNRLDNDRGDFLAMLRHDALTTAQVVEGCDQGAAFEIALSL